jgi:ferredoxin--NADP+ reductase
MSNDNVELLTAPTVAIVGSGPSGCYLAQFLRKRWADAEITIFDRLETPYGLVRYGVAPDHVGTKAVAKQFDRLFERDNVRFLGNVEIGTDFTLDQLTEACDIVVLATGLHGDRKLMIPGSDLVGVYGSGRITRLINDHPEESANGVNLGKNVTIVGQGNVSIDLVRLLLSSADDLRRHGVHEDVIALFHEGPVTHIDVVGRSAPHLAKYDSAMIRELVKLPGVKFHADLPEAGAAVEDKEALAKLDALGVLIDAAEETLTRSVRFHFGWGPKAITGEERVTGIEFQAADDVSRELQLKADAVITAIGFTEQTSAVLRREHHESEESNLETGYLSPGLYCVGWLRRGPQGTIPANRADAKMVAEVIIGAVEAGEIAPHKPGLSALNHTFSTR